MYTHCPKCRYSKKVSRKQLKKKRGQVYCPECKQQFNAYLTLEKTPAPQATETERQSPRISLPEAPIPELTALIKQQSQAPEEITTENAADRYIKPEPTHTKKPETVKQPTTELYSWQQPKTPFRTAFWLSAVILGVVLFVFQVHYFKGYSLSQDPQIRPWLSRLYKFTNTPLPYYRKPQEFTTIGSSLDAEKQGRYRLRVSFINHADFRQPLPYLKLTLQNYYGGIFAQRIFSPQEYLSKSNTLKYIERSETVDINFLIAPPEQEVGGYTIELK